MSDLTKRALSEALKEALLHKSLEKITVTELAKACGVNRMTFYYHFQDIYALAEWSLAHETERVMADKITPSTWVEGLEEIFRLMQKNQNYIEGLNQPSTRIHLERYVNNLTDTLFIGILEELSRGFILDPQDEEFIAAFYRHAFIGIIIDWITKGMKEKPEDVVDKLRLVTEGILIKVIKKFARK